MISTFLRFLDRLWVNEYNPDTMRNKFGPYARCTRLAAHRQLALIAFTILLVFHLISPFQSTADASLIPTSWTLSAGVQESGGIQAVDFNVVVQAPVFNHSQSAVLGPSQSTAQYAFNIGQSVADYVVNVQHRCVNHDNANGNANPTCNSFGRIILTPSVDVLLSAEMSYDYFLPSDPVDASISLTTSLSSPHQLLLNLGDFDNTTLGGPHGGTLSISGASTILPAGRTATVQYQFRTSFYPGSATGLLGTGDGSIHISMVAIPEPATSIPLALSLLMIRKRPRRALS